MAVGQWMDRCWKESWMDEQMDGCWLEGWMGGSMNIEWMLNRWMDGILPSRNVGSQFGRQLTVLHGMKDRCC